MNKKMELPEVWKIAKLGDICFTTSGGTPSRKVPEYYTGDIPWIKSGELDKGLILDSEEKISVDAVKNSSAKVFPKGTLLIALYGATIGKLAFLGIDASTNQAICGIYKNDNIDQKYLYYYLFAKRSFLIKQGIGGAQPNISQTILKNLDVPLPPLSEQHQIVEKIEELFSELDKGIENLKTAQQQLKVYRQAVLKWAFEGKLTNEHVKDGELPERWELTKLKDITKEISDGDHQPPPKTQTGVPFITISNVDKNNYKIDFSDTFTVSNDYYQKLKDNRKPFKGDVLYTVTGSFGIPILIDFEKQFCFQRHIGLIRPLESTNQRWLYYLLQSPQVFNQAKSTATGTAQKTVALSSLRNFLVPLTTLNEQILIVNEIESRLSVCDKIEETITTSLQQAEALRQSILKKAFEGKLVKLQEETPIVNLRALINTEDEREIQRKALAGKIIELCHADNNFGHTKFQKTLHLSEYHAQFEFDSNHIKQVAGPFDKDFFFPFLEEAKIYNWFTEKQMRDITYFKPATGLKTLTKNYNGIKTEQQHKVQFVIDLLKDKTTAESELISTIYAVWNNYLITNRDINQEQLTKEIYDWSESKSKFSKEDILGTWKWMMEVGLKPVGFGKLIEK